LKAECLYNAIAVVSPCKAEHLHITVAVFGLLWKQSNLLTHAHCSCSWGQVCQMTGISPAWPVFCC